MKRTPGFSAGADYEVTSSLNIKQFPEFFRETILPNVIYAFQLAGYYISCAFINVRYFLMTLSPRNLTALILAAAIPVLAIVSLIVSSFQGGSAQPASPLAVTGITILIPVTMERKLMETNMMESRMNLPLVHI